MAPNTRYLNAVDQIYHGTWAAGKLARLRRIQAIVAQLWPAGHPTRMIQVVGTSGKGSTARFLEAGFGLVGIAGSFTGPHLFDYRERFSIGGTPPPPDDIASAWEQVVLPISLDLAERTDKPLSFFESTILIALVLFERHQVRWAAIEAGVGGRYDQTSALPVVACALTNVGRDHEHLLGSEPWQRAIDKAGAARAGAPLFTSETDPAVLEVIASVCNDVGAPLHLVGEREMQTLCATLGGAIPAESLLRAQYQQRNAALSLALLTHLLPEIDTAQAVQRFLQVRIPGRLTEVEPGIYADVAHNPDKVAALADEVRARFTGWGKIFVVGVSGQRQASAVLAPLLDLADAIIITRSSYHGQDPAAIRSALEALRPRGSIAVIDDPQAAIAAARAMRGDDQMIFLTGSTYMIDQAINPDPYLRHVNGTYGWREKE